MTGVQTCALPICRLTRAFPERAQKLFAENQKAAEERYEHLTRLVELYK